MPLLSKKLLLLRSCKFNLIILFNKDYLINKVTQRYLLIYIKYVVFKTRMDIFVISILYLVILGFMAYILQYLIVHPIIIG